ncbi:hypothetical protein N657DRAFT_650397 [Parathielavia appendiculata]|uniref:Uncharacterized protein n=1 Tax=Parathielavia appendiculata TaxID=2587402 RepID=A0AAN6TRF5_9PEZI|nr:hypothetical protein N657DRAFT_650397 [Parathielavia appendiculata]
MQLSLALTLLTAALGTTNPVDTTSAPQARAALDDLAGTPLSKRACSFNGCKCIKGTPQGQYCGNCDAVITDQLNDDHIYECSPSGACCDYGSSNHCGSTSVRPLCGA